MTRRSDQIGQELVPFAKGSNQVLLAVGCAPAAENFADSDNPKSWNSDPLLIDIVVAAGLPCLQHFPAPIRTTVKLETTSRLLDGTRHSSCTASRGDPVGLHSTRPVLAGAAVRYSTPPMMIQASPPRTSPCAWGLIMFPSHRSYQPDGIGHVSLATSSPHRCLRKELQFSNFRIQRP